MEKRLFVGIGVILLLASGVVFVLLQGADLPNRNNNGFNRTVLYEFAKPISEKNIGKQVVRISGTTLNCIYFSGMNPSWMLRMDLHLNVVDTLGYGISAGNDLKDPLTYVDSPQLYMYATGTAYLLKGKVDSSRIDTLKLESELITRVAQISSTKLVTRGIDMSQTKQVFRILNAENGSLIKEVDIIENQQFGGFDADGYLEYDKLSNKIVYVQMYQNRFFCLDTALNVLVTSNTIDTTFTNPVNIGLVNEGGETKVMAQKPRIVVNKLAKVYNNRIFVVSGLRGDNEGWSDFNNSFPVDMYNIPDGKYIGSVRLPKLNGKAILDFKVTDKYWIVLYDEGKCAVFDVDK